jgi:hypothetical protein
MIIERSDYSASAWLADLTNIIKKRGFLDKKENAWLVIEENIVDLIELYEGGASPSEAFMEYSQ